MPGLFDPISINSLTLRNRIIMPCLDPGFAGEGGLVNQRTVDYFLRRARGGVAFIMVGPAVFDPVGVGGAFEYRIYRDEVLDGLRKLVKAIHEAGVPVGLQLHHAGRQANPHLIDGTPVAPSALMCPVRRSMPRALSLREIEKVILEYGIAAQRAKEAGFDAVEVHGSHGYLITEFLSPYSNARTDLYGGSLENRSRFPYEVIQEVRRKVGVRFPILFRIPGAEHVEGGLEPGETGRIGRLMEKAGVDAIDVSAGNYRTAEWIVPPMTLPRACNVPAAQEIKRHVKVPVIVAGRINDPQLALEILEEGKADIIAMARGLVADPDLPLKIEAGLGGEVRRCIACNVCIDRLFQEKDIVCTVNPEVGREAEFDVGTVDAPKRVMVIGGGPGGMEAARMVRLRGHEVMLYEEDSRLGGLMEAASKASFKEELKSVTAYYEAVLGKLGVSVNLGVKADVGTVLRVNPDAVVLATGSSPHVPDVPGVTLPHVVQAVDVLLGKVRIENNAVVVGGGTVGCEVAMFLAEKGCKVTVTEMGPYVAQGIPRLLGKMMKDMMRKAGVTFLTDHRVTGIAKGQVACQEIGGKTRSLPADWVVLAVGLQSRDDLRDALTSKFQKVYSIGDCVEPRKLGDAIREGAETALRL
jgi:2,4-dienoyl-CoA reductase-like NADH-dependent reductase (Old Yellow Enzyme family)/thioredoxin reductase